MLIYFLLNISKFYEKRYKLMKSFRDLNYVNYQYWSTKNVAFFYWLFTKENVQIHIIMKWIISMSYSEFLCYKQVSVYRYLADWLTVTSVNIDKKGHFFLSRFYYFKKDISFIF